MHRATWLLFAVVLLDLVGFGIVIPILPFMAPRLGGSELDVGLIISTYALTAALVAPLWGRLSDRIGRKPVIIVCLTGAAAGYVLLGVAHELWMLYAARAFAGALAGNFGVASAMMADITTPADRARGMGLIGAAFGLGLLLGPLLGGLLAGEGDSFLWPALMAGAMSLFAVVAAALFLPESVDREQRATLRRERARHGGESGLAMLRRTRSRMLLLQYMLHTTSVSAATYLFPLWAADLAGWRAREVGIVFGAIGVSMVVTQGGLIGPLVRHLGELRVLKICSSLLFLGLLGAVFADSATTMAGAVWIALSGATLCVPMLNSMVSQRAEAALRGRMLGLAASASAVGRVLGPVLGGLLLMTLSWRPAWLCLAVIAAAYCYWAWRHATLAPPHDNQQAPGAAPPASA